MFSFHSEFTEFSSNSFHTLLEITPNSVIDAKKPAKRIVYVLDLSESSNDLAKESIIRSMLFLREIDEVSVVTFSSESSVDIGQRAKVLIDNGARSPRDRRNHPV